MDEVKLLPWPFFGYAPGSYTSRCYRCDQEFDHADKGSITCLECAVVQAKTHIAELEATRPTLVTDEVVESVKASLEDVFYDTLDCAFDADLLARAALAAMPAIPPQSLGESVGAIPGSHPADQAPSGLGASRFDPERG